MSADIQRIRQWLLAEFASQTRHTPAILDPLFRVDISNAKDGVNIEFGYGKRESNKVNAEFPLETLDLPQDAFREAVKSLATQLVAKCS